MFKLKYNEYFYKSGILSENDYFTRFIEFTNELELNNSLFNGNRVIPSKQLSFNEFLQLYNKKKLLKVK